MRSHCGDIETAWYEVGSGPPLILVHGLGDDHRAWRGCLWLLLLVLLLSVPLLWLTGRSDTTKAPEPSPSAARK